MKQTVFIIGSVWIEPTSSAAGSRMLQLLELFLSQGWEVNFGTTAVKSNNSIDLQELGVQEYSIALNDISFDRLIAELNPSIVLFDRFITEEQFGWRVAQNCPKALRILDTEDLHCLRKTRHEALKKGIDFSNEQLLNSDIAKREIAAVYRSDLSLMISSFEMNLLQEVFGVDQKLLAYVPFLLPKIDMEQTKSLPSFTSRKGFISIGTFLHAPNLDATIQLKKDIWKRIRERLPEAKLLVCGAYPTQQVREFHNEKEGFIVKGYVEDAHEAIKSSRVLLAPLRFGAGLKGKLIDAMHCGTPTVTTSIGAEGMQENTLWGGAVEDDIEVFVDHAVNLYTNESEWNQAQQKGFQVYNQLFDKEKHSQELLAQITLTMNVLEIHRTQNFIGNMLTHHTMQSAKYLSKWIEAKNR